MTLLMVKHVMIEDLVTANPDIPLKDAVEILQKRHIGSLVITDSKNNCLGIFTERDLIRAISQSVDLGTPIEEVMTKNVLTIGEEASIEEAKRLLITHKVRHLPVINEEGKLIGLFSVRKLLDDFFGLQSSKYC
ncbi:MAG: CBS domain-containing protein [Candidatus Bathyarchaeota archaeon]